MTATDVDWCDVLGAGGGVESVSLLHAVAADTMAALPTTASAIRIGKTFFFTTTPRSWIEKWSARAPESDG
ncbi:hypothetical protein FOY51_21325 [Antrihabitans cavernicola]|uniref:Uncharacterized protein n=1 Tax=Antrihabitans cavernicola TaxID=2495913 RepID=A0A5A7S603_9NOCA|nr:hypothetical protein FOY51_21325 [Spelaeibacter cavernicola]